MKAPKGKLKDDTYELDWRNTYKSQHIMQIAPKWCLQCLSKNNTWS